MTTSMVALKNGHILQQFHQTMMKLRDLAGNAEKKKIGEAQRYGWERRRRRRMMNLRDIAGNVEEEW